MTLRVLNDRERLIETHRLIVEGRRSERREVMTFQIRAGVSEQSKTGGVRFRKTIERKRRDLFDNLILCPANNSLLRHTAPQLYFDVLHSLLRSLKAHRPPQLLRFAAGEICANHGHLQ